MLYRVEFKREQANYFLEVKANNVTKAKQAVLKRFPDAWIKLTYPKEAA